MSSQAESRELSLIDQETATQLLVAIVEASDDAIISKTLDGIITSWNAGAMRHFGYTAEEAVGKHISLLIPEDRLQEEDLIISRLKLGERVDHFDTVRVRKDGKYLNVSLTISPIRNAAGKIVGASKIARDITERKELEDELARYAADLSEAHRRKNEFLAMLAHELRNPLAPLRNSIQVLRATNDDLGPPLDIMDRQVGQLVRLVDDLLDVSRITSGKIELRRERIDLNTLVLYAVETTRPNCDAGGIAVKVSLPDSPTWLMGDPARLTQVVGNLLNNSCKFTDKGGMIDVSLQSDNEHASIRVRDTGIGIAPEKLSRIFDLFVQADTSLERATSGLGIGLTLVKNLVEMHGGTVEARSEGLGDGCEFILDLPLSVADRSGADRRALSENAGKEEVAGKKILVVDDNMDSAESLSVLLRLSGHNVRTANDGIEAVMISDEFVPDVILLDIGLPRLNGYEAARVIRRRLWGSDVKLIALTGWGQKEDRDRSKAAGFDIHLVKPVDHEELLALLSEPESGK